MSPPAHAPVSVRCAVLGHPILHSLSPRAHQAALEAWGMDGESRAIDLPPSRLASVLQALHARGVFGINVTAPLKRAAFEHAVARTTEAEAAGVANCLQRVDAGYLATNTDGAGFLDFLGEIGVDVARARVVLLGSGGSAAGLAAALREAGAFVEIVARTARGPSAWGGLRDATAHAWGSDAARDAIERATVVVNTTPLGAHASSASPLADAVPAAGARLVDLRYARPAPAWLEEARARGAVTYDGRGLFVAQAARSLAFWFGRTPPLDRLREVAGWIPERNQSSGSASA